MLPQRLQKKIDQRRTSDSLRKLRDSTGLTDFSSNDYLGFSRSDKIADRANAILMGSLAKNGSGGSRLLSGNHQLYPEAEKLLAKTHKTEAALIFNSGYDANIGFFSSVPQRGDVILYDEYIHASIRDGITMSRANAYKFAHNDLQSLKQKLDQAKSGVQDSEIYIVTESVFSMDGDSPDLKGIVNLKSQYGSHLIVDEAHALGVMGAGGLGLVQDLGLEEEIFARLITFGKALGCHGAAVLGSEDLKTYLVNFARSLIYTTALPPHSVATILAACELFTSVAENKSDNTFTEAFKSLRQNISLFSDLTRQEKNSLFISGESAIRSAIIPGNSRVRSISNKFKDAGFDVKPILSPTVPEGQERLRFCLHSYNSATEIRSVLELLNELTN